MKPDILDEINTVQSEYDSDLAKLRSKFLGKYGQLTYLLESLKHVDPSEKKDAGEALNKLAKHIQGK